MSTVKGFSLTRRDVAILEFIANALYLNWNSKSLKENLMMSFGMCQKDPVWNILLSLFEIGNRSVFILTLRVCLCLVTTLENGTIILAFDFQFYGILMPYKHN